MMEVTEFTVIVAGVRGQVMGRLGRGGDLWRVGYGVDTPRG